MIIYCEVVARFVHSHVRKGNTWMNMGLALRFMSYKLFVRMGTLLFCNLQGDTSTRYNFGTYFKRETSDFGFYLFNHDDFLSFLVSLPLKSRSSIIQCTRNVYYEFHCHFIGLFFFYHFTNDIQNNWSLVCQLNIRADNVWPSFSLQRFGQSDNPNRCIFKF